VPLDPLLRESGDAGEPLMLREREDDAARELDRIADALVAADRGTIVKPLTLVST
jgi:hypothetical protein